MANYEAIARQLAKKYRLPYFPKQIRQESGFNPRARSPAGALGIAQIMPATAAGWGVDPMNPRAALEAAAKNMRAYEDKYGGARNALIAYNAGPGRVGSKNLPSETLNYIRAILGNNPGRASAPHHANASLIASMGGNVPGSTMDTPTQPSVYDVIRQYRDATRPEQGSSYLFQPFDPEKSANQIQDTVARITAMRNKPTPVASSALGDVASGFEASGNGKIKITGPNPKRIQPGVRRIMMGMSDVLGGDTIIGSDGTGHSKYTVNGNVSEHYTGNASDIPAKGRRLIQLGQAALIAAGMDPREARKKRGGLFNIQTKHGRVQVIFNTQEGGDHTDHVHVGVH